MAESPVKIFGRVTVAMLGIGLAIGLGAYFVWVWAEAIVFPGVSTSNAALLGKVLPLIFLIVTAMTAPVAASLIGIFEGLRSDNIRNTVLVSLACILGAVLMVVIAAIFIGQTGLEEEESSGPGFTDIIKLAGLSGIASFVGAFITTKLGAK